MYRNERHALLFPRLWHMGETPFESWGGEGPTQVYKLEWARLDTKALKQTNPRGQSKRRRLFPASYIDWMDGLQFAIPYHYRREIRRCTKMAMLEWDRALPFDTSVREMCLSTAESFIDVALRLVADCGYDPEKQGFYSGPRHTLIPYALLYRFWDGQTGRGLLWQFAGLDSLVGSEVQEEVGFVRAIKKAYKKHEEQILRSMEDTDAAVAAG